MSRRDYQLIADVIRDSAIPKPLRDGLAHNFADKLAGTNAGFKRERFLNACEGR